DQLLEFLERDVPALLRVVELAVRVPLDHVRHPRSLAFRVGRHKAAAEPLLYWGGLYNPSPTRSPIQEVPMQLKGRTALITGASRGIGRAIALALAEEGADVGINYVANDAAAKAVAEQIQKMGRKALVVN